MLCVYETIPKDTVTAVEGEAGVAYELQRLPFGSEAGAGASSSRVGGPLAMFTFLATRRHPPHVNRDPLFLCPSRNLSSNALTGTLLPLASLTSLQFLYAPSSPTRLFLRLLAPYFAPYTCIRFIWKSG